MNNVSMIKVVSRFQHLRQLSSMSNLVLYKRDASPPSNAVRMLGQILNLKFDYKEPDVLSLEHKSPEFRKINPMMTIPVLEDGDFTVSESHAIMQYLVAKYGGEQREKLYPSDVKVRAIIDQCMYFDAGVLFIRLKNVALPTFLLGLPSPTSKHIEAIEEAYGMLEAYLERNKYVAADHLTLADLSVGSTVEHMQPIHEVDPEKFPLIIKWLALLNKESYFQEINKPGAAVFGVALQAFWRKNKKEQQ